MIWNRPASYWLLGVGRLSESSHQLLCTVWRSITITRCVFQKPYICEMFGSNCERAKLTFKKLIGIRSYRLQSMNLLPIPRSLSKQIYRLTGRHMKTMENTCLWDWKSAPTKQGQSVCSSVYNPWKHLQGLNRDMWSTTHFHTSTCEAFQQNVYRNLCAVTIFHHSWPANMLIECNERGTLMTDTSHL